MKILILGIDGYIGWPLALTLLEEGHKVYGLDNYSRRARVERIGSNSLTPIPLPVERRRILRNYDGFKDEIARFTLGVFEPFALSNMLKEFCPDTIVHLAEQPSAPWSMKSVEWAAITQAENVIGNLHLLWAIHEQCPETHLVKLGSMGEYGTPECVIPEGYIPNKPCAWTRAKGLYEEASNLARLERKCPMSSLPFPKQPGSWYHLSKVHDTNNINFACRNWNLRATDIMQGVVFGLGNFDQELITRFDYDEYFGTVINRFCAQAVLGHPLTVYGEGNQTRGFLPLKDSLQCLSLVINNPPELGEHRIFNQYESAYKINYLADIVCDAAKSYGLNPSIDHIHNPRKELESHSYITSNDGLIDLGYEPTTDIESEIDTLVGQLLPFKYRIVPEVIMPETSWRGN